MPYYSDPTLYSTPVSSYSLYLSGPYSTHSSLIASRSARPSNTYVKPISRFHRGYAPHLATISENQVNSSLRRKYSPHIPYSQGSAKYKVPRPIKINTADIDVSADRYKSRITPSSLDISKTRIPERKRDLSKSPSPIKSDDAEEFIPKPIRRDRPTVRLHTVHKDEEKKLKKTTDIDTEKEQPPPKDDENHSIPSDTNNAIAPTEEPRKLKPIKKNPSFHDICTAISHDNINEELNPGQPETVKHKQRRTLSNEDFSNQVRQDSTEIVKENGNLVDRVVDEEQLNKKHDKPEQEVDMIREDNKFDPRGSVKRKKKIAKKKTNESLGSDDESNVERCQLQRRPVKKMKRTSTITVPNDVVENLDKNQQEVIKDISNVEVEEIKTKPKQVISATVEIDEPKQRKPNLKLVIDDVKVEEVQSPKVLKKFKFNVTVNVETENSESAKLNDAKKDKCKITKDKVHMPKAKDALLTNIRKNHQRASLGDIYEGIEELPSKKTDRTSIINGEIIQTELEDDKNKLILINLPDENGLDNSNKSDKSEIIPDGGVSDIDPVKKANNNLVKEESSEILQQTVEVLDKKVNDIEIKENHVENDFKIEEKLEPVEDKDKQDDIMVDKKDGSNTQIHLPSLKELQAKSNKKEDQNITRNVETSKLDVLQSPIDHFDKQLNKEILGGNKEAASPTLKAKKIEKNLQKQDGNKLVQNAKPTLKIFQKTKTLEQSSPEIKPALAPKEDNQSTENFWALIGSRDSVYVNPETVFKRNAIYIENSVEKENEKNEITQEKIVEEINKQEKVPVKEDEVLKEDNVTTVKEDEVVLLKEDNVTTEEIDEKEIIETKIVSKGSLVSKAKTEDPDLKIFSAPPTPEPVEPESPKSGFTPLQSNRLSQWMHPWKKPAQFDECPVEIFARPKPIKGRHIPKPRNLQPAPPPPPPPQQTGSSDSEEETSSDEESGDSEEVVTTTDDEANVGKSTSSNDSGFNSSTNGSSTMQRNKDCDVNIHRKCEKLTANLCGINQKLIVEAIESVKKGSSDSRDSPTSNPAHNPAFALDPVDTLEECYTSSTYAGFQKSGRITPPATTIPRFRKYCVEDFNFLKVLGKGSFGKVLLAELKDTEYYYAIKCLKKDVVLEDDDVECTLIERKVLALGTKHPYLCHLLCTFQTESHLFFVMEYLNGGDLMFHIQMSGRFPEPRACIYGAEIVSGLKFLHTKGIVYRDLKLDNILLDFDGHVRIADFGMCKLQIFLDRMADTFCGTPDYMAPEIIKGLHYNQCVDWWSFGVLLYEMLIGQSPFSGCDEDELFWSICNEKPVIPRFLSAEATSILKQLLEKDGSKRLGNKLSPHGDIQDHQFFRPISWDLLERRQLEAPFKPNLQHPLDTQYFDKTFTVEKAKLTPIDKNILQSMDQAQFQGFSYTNPNATDR